MIAEMRHPMGPHNPACEERQPRMDKKVMPPRPDWNALGPYISKRWRAALARISPRLTLQYFPYGVIPGTGVRGFWAVCMRLPRSRMLYKQTVLSLTDGRGRVQHPDWGMLHELKHAWHTQRHEGMDAIFDSIDAEMEGEQGEIEQREFEALYDKVERDLAKVKYQNPSHVAVPA
jgi:hypothetical protein